jgi:hypothetical protein
MRKFYFLNLILLICVCNICRAQTRHTLTAVVADSATRQPLELTTVVVLKVSDTSLISYTLTDKNGVFAIRNLKDNEPARLLISHAGYVSLHYSIRFGKSPVLKLDTLFLGQRTLAEITIKGEIVPVVIKKDTIEFNAEAFKVRPNALVQDLLKKLPGVQVDRDGTITVEGKSISKIKVDGRDFFANDPKIVTRNLDADMVAKVQIYDDRENDPDHLVPEYQVKKIINLKFKKQFSKSTFGKVVAGAGTQGRYDIDGLYNQSVDNLQISFIGNSKNLGSTEFVGTSLSGFGPGEGIPQVTNTGLNINDNFGKNIKLNLVYNYTNRIFNNLQAKNVAQFLGDTTLTNNSSNRIHNVSNTHNVTGTLDWAVDSLTQVKYAPQLEITGNGADNFSQATSFNNFVPLLTKTMDADNGNGNSVQYQHTIAYYHAFHKKGESVTITNTIDVNPNKNIDISTDGLISYTAGLSPDTLDRLANTKNRNTATALSAEYHYPIGKYLTAGIVFSGAYNNNGADLFTYDLNPKTGLYNIFLPSQSSDLTRNQWQQNGHPELIYQKNNINLNIGFIAEAQQIDNEFNQNIPDLDQHFTYLFPFISLTVNKVNFSYTEDVRQPTVSQLMPITLIYDPLDSFQGNPDLKPTRLHNFSISYNNYIQQTEMFINLSAKVIVETNSLIQESLVSAEGAQLTTPINKNGRFTTYVTGNVGKSFKKSGKWQLRESIGLNASAGRNFFEANYKDGYQDTYAFPIYEQLSIDWDGVIDFDPSYIINPAFTRYELVSYPAVSYVQQTISLPLDVEWPEKMNWSLNYTHIYNPLVAQGFQRQSNLFSFSVARSFQQKDRGELRLTCYDLFNQSVSAIHFASNNTINDIQNEAIRRYFILTYTYRFNKTKK